MKIFIPLKWRFAFLVIELGAIVFANSYATGQIMPSFNPDGWWIWAAILGLLLGKRLDTPFFAKPVDVVLFALPTIFALIQSGGSAYSNFHPNEMVFFWISLVYTLVVALVAIFAILTQSKDKSAQSNTHQLLKMLSDRIGMPTTFFSVLFWLFVIGFNNTSGNQILCAAVAWILTVAFSPLDELYKLITSAYRLFTSKRKYDIFGNVNAFHSPGLVTIKMSQGNAMSAGMTCAMRDPVNGDKILLLLDSAGRDEDLFARAIEIPLSESDKLIKAILREFTPYTVIKVQEYDFEHTNLPPKDSLIGVVAPETSLTWLNFYLVQNKLLEEGQLIEVSIRGQSVLYQIINGKIKEDTVHQKHTFGYIQVLARKIGSWSEEQKRFMPVKWLPDANSLVLSKKYTVVDELDLDAIGTCPGTNYAIRIKNVTELVTHNCAILGILGVGKSMLALELIERMIAGRVKIICLDLTDQYANELGPYFDREYERASLARIQDACAEAGDEWADNPIEGGSLPDLRKALKHDIENFLSENNARPLKIYNPSLFSVTKQTDEPKNNKKADGSWSRNATLWKLTPVEVTRIIAEITLEISQSKGMTNSARVCLVFEEAHSLVPEFTAIASSTDKEACNGTARAILQGRKFGLGCMIVTQRTASVAKTILNQCNTVFAMRIFDETGKEFLANYIGSEYTQSLSSLNDRHAIVFGKASSCSEPVLVKLNERSLFTTAFRVAHPPQLPVFEELNTHQESSAGEETPVPPTADPSAIEK